MSGIAMPWETDMLLSEKRLAEDLPVFFDHFQDRFLAAPHAVSFAVAGQHFICRAQGDHYAAILRRAFRLQPVASPSTVRIVVEHRSSALSPGWPCWNDPFFREREVEARLEEGKFRFHYYDQSDFWQIFNRNSLHAIQLMTGSTGYPEWEPGSPLRNFVHWGLIEIGSGLVHAGTLGVGGQGVLLAGAGGSGKSGTVLAGLAHGLQSVGDDYVAVSFGDEIRAHLVFNGLKQDPAGLERLGLGDRLDEQTPVNWQGKHVFTMQELGLAEQPQQISIKALCLPSVAHAERTGFTPVTSREAFLALAPSSVTQVPSARAESFRISAAVARKLPAFRVILGTQPAEIADAFGHFIERLA